MKAQPSSTPLQFRSAATSPLGRISMAGYLPANRGLPAEPMRVLGSYATVYIVRGEGRYADANGYSQRVGAGDLLLLFPELGHAYGPPAGETWAEIYHVFDGPVFELWRVHGLLDPRQPVRHLEPVDYWRRRFDAILGAAPLVELCRLQTALAEALGGGPAAPERAWVTQAQALLQTDLERVVELPELARQLGMSYERFRKRFARAVGLPPAQYRLRCLIDRACELMQRGALNDKQIAAALGFCDEFHFSRRFKRITGLPPREFRRRLPR